MFIYSPSLSSTFFHITAKLCVLLHRKVFQLGFKLLTRVKGKATKETAQIAKSENPWMQDPENVQNTTKSPI